MCLIAAAWLAHPRWRLLLAGNRDEYHARPAAPAARWADAPQVLAGRDLEAGGTWIGVSEAGRACVVTNFRDPRADMGGRSRGLLGAGFLRDAAPVGAWAEALAARAAGYRPFNLLLFDRDAARYVGNHPVARVEALAPGVHGLSNGALEARWPKTERLTAALQAWLARGDDDFVPLFAALADAAPAPDAALPHTGIDLELERRLSAPFIRGERYGTRASTVIALGHDGTGVLVERRFGPGGRADGETALRFKSAA
ncbi:MAG: NRDE family protein [Mizugakiibacter sp.]|uniref:NRDE family protein n=1 Tax=Mizugakiibacter sp. TaxID=1972610 RepID=UPI0031C18F32|nr:NRDE family protein [Xanthomonadaceae bacterium]